MKELEITGIEPTPEDPTGFQVQRLNHSADADISEMVLLI